jgi:hypothetical protein
MRIGLWDTVAGSRAYERDGHHRFAERRKFVVATPAREAARDRRACRVITLDHTARGSQVWSWST